MNNFSMSMYNPQKTTSDIPFTIEFGSGVAEIPNELLKQHKVLTFNNESADDFCQNNLPIDFIYATPLSLILRNSKNGEYIGFASMIIINTKLILKDELDMAELPKYMSFDDKDDLIEKYLLTFTDETGLMAKSENSQHLYINKIAIDTKYRGKGFGRYLFENIPEFVQRVFNYNFNRTIIPWMLLYTKGDKSILKSEEKMNELHLNSLNAFLHILKTLKYDLIYSDNETKTQLLFSKEYR